MKSAPLQNKSSLQLRVMRTKMMKKDCSKLKFNND